MVFHRCMLIGILLAAMTGIAGCGGSPARVVENFSIAIIENDFDKARSYCTESFGNSFVTPMESIMSMMPDEYTDELSDVDIDTVLSGEDLESSIDGGTARVWHKDAPFTVYVLTKDGLSWKISSIDVDYSALGEMMQDLNLGNPNF